MIQIKCDICKGTYTDISKIVNLEATQLLSGYLVSNYQICDTCRKSIFGNAIELNASQLKRCVKNIKMEAKT